MKDLILLHGALGHVGHFEQLAAMLSPHFRIHTFDFYGHGTSALPQQGIAMQDYVEQLQAFCEAEKLVQPYIFGYSMGGYVALCYALANPGRVVSVLTLATKFDWTIDGAAKEAAMLQPDKIAEKIPRYAMQLEAIHGKDKWRELLPAIAGMMTKLGAQPILQSEQLQQIDMPVQLMVGDLDVMVSIEETRNVARQISNARFAVLPATKHSIEQVRLSLLVDLIKDFWNEIS